MTQDRIVVGIDVGTTKVCVLIGEAGDDERVEVIGVGIAPARGMRKGIVVGAEEAVEAIEAAVRRAEQQSGYKIVSAFVSISGAHLSSENSHGVVAVRGPGSLITPQDVERVLEAARTVSVPPDREVVHVLPRHFTVDGQDGVRDPVGMAGHRLEVETNIVTGALAAVHNLTRCIERLGVEIDALVPSALAAGEGVLREAEKDQGVLLIDIGGGTTDVAIFVDGSVEHLFSLPVGGYQITNDLAVALRTSYMVADSIKVQYGAACVDAVQQDSSVTLQETDNGGRRVTTTRVEIAGYIEARLAETFELIIDRLRRARSERDLPAGVVLTGGSAQLPGIQHLAESIFDLPARIGQPRGIYGLIDTISNPAYATGVGLLRWGKTQLGEFEAEEANGSGPRILHGLAKWLRSFLP